MIGKGAFADKNTARIVAAMVILFTLPALTWGFNMNEVNRFYQTKECPKCDLTFASFLRLKAPGANLAEARCKGINLTDAVLDHSDFRGADFSGARLFAADLRNAKLQRTNLKGANLVIADLSGADLSNANLSGANLKGANLAGARIEGADLSGATWPDWGRCGPGSIGECKK
jgi:uncharacterized protein YjbI with pentapeptide repeats